jgi:Protein of unknown function (DUF3102)
MSEPTVAQPQPTVSGRAYGTPWSDAPLKLLERVPLSNAELRKAAGVVNRLHGEVESQTRSALASAIECGKILRRIKATVGHGVFLPWLEANFEGSVRTAQAYMRVARGSENAQFAAHISLAQALRFLARPSEQDRSMERCLSQLSLGEWVASVGGVQADGSAEVTRLKHLNRRGRCIVSPKNGTGVDILAVRAAEVGYPVEEQSFLALLEQDASSLAAGERSRGRVFRDYQLAEQDEEEPPVATIPIDSAASAVAALARIFTEAELRRALDEYRERERVKEQR